MDQRAGGCAWPPIAWAVGSACAFNRQMHSGSIGALIVGSVCEGRPSDHAQRCAGGKEEEGTGCCGHFERPTRCAFNAAWDASLNITWLMRSARRPLILAESSAGCCIRACYVMWLPAGRLGMSGTVRALGCRVRLPWCVWVGRVMLHRRNEDAA